MKLKKLASILALSLGLGAMAAPAYSGSNLYFFEDDDLEWVLRPDAGSPTGYTEITSGTLSVGDVLYSVFEIPFFEINGVNAIPAGMELTGVAAVEVAFSSGGGAFAFRPWAGFGHGAGSMVAMWLNDLTTNVDLVGTNSSQLSCTTLAGCTAQATAGTQFQIDGFLGDPDEFWTALATTTDIAAIKAGASSTPFAVFNAGLSNLFNTSGPVSFINPVTGAECVDTTGCVQFLVSGSVLGGGGLADTTIVGRSDFQGQKFVVPEPGTLALLGLGLLGLSATVRRRKA